AGWGFWYDDASGLIVGTVGYHVPGLYRYHLKRMNQTVGLRPESGEVVWRRRGSDPFCHPDRADEPGLGDFPLLACTWTSGVVIYPHHPKSGKHVQVKRAHLLLERLDPATGTSQWTVDLGHADEAVDRAGSTLLSLTGGSALFVDTGTRRLRVDWRTGRHRPVQASTIHWASDDTTFRYQVPWVVDGHSTRDRYGDGVFSPRSPSGRVVHRVPDSIPAGVGTDFPGSSVIVASKGRITAYTLGS
ncbi:MAG: hypothetical protein ACRDP4_13035, partial [Nocardioidaceae bacterium]